jgi:uncharacterized protein
VGITCDARFFWLSFSNPVDMLGFIDLPPSDNTMIIGLLSDTHDHTQNTKIALVMLRNLGAEVILHAGDYCAPFMIPLFGNWALHGVFGNNDGDHFRIQQRFSEIDGTLHAEFMDREFDGRRIAMYHGTQGGITDALIGCGTYDLVVTGHTHQAVNNQVGKTLHVNPGSVNGLGNPATFAIYDTVTGFAEIIGI